MGYWKFPVVKNGMDVFKSAALIVPGLATEKERAITVGRTWWKAKARRGKVQWQKGAYHEEGAYYDEGSNY